MATEPAVKPRPFTVTNRMVVAIAAPTTLAYISTPLIGIVDTGVVGRLGDAALIGGLAVGAVLFDVVFTTFNFLRASTVALVAQAQGEGDDERQKVVLLRALLISLGVGLAIVVLAPLILLGRPVGDECARSGRERGEGLFHDPHSGRTADAHQLLASSAGRSGLGRAGLGLALQTLLNGTNVALSIWLGLSLGWGLEGVAWATVAAEALAAVVGLAIAARTLRAIPWPDRARLFDREALQRLFNVNRDIMIRSFCLLFAFAFFTARSAQYGETTLAANAVLMNFFLVSGYFLDGFATAAEQLAGKSVGARYRPAFDATVRLTLIWGLVLAAFATAVFFAVGPTVIDLLTTAPDVRVVAREYLPWAAITALAGLVAFQMDGVFIGATWSADMRNMMLVSVAVYLLVWWLATPVLGNHGLWLALNVFLAARGLTLYLRMGVRVRETFG